VGMSKQPETPNLRVLRKTALGQYLDEKKSLVGLAEQFETVTLKEKGVIYQQGEQNDSLYFVLEGTVDIEVWTDPNPKYVEPKKDEEQGEEIKIVQHRLISPNGKKVDPKKAQKVMLCRKQAGEFFNQRGFCGNIDLKNTIFMSTGAVKGTMLVLTKAKYDKYARPRNDERKFRKTVNHALGFKFDEVLRESLPYLAQIDAAKLQLLAQNFRPFVVRKGTELFHEGDLGGAKGNSMYYVSEGQIDLKANDKKEGKEKAVAQLGRGAFIGEVGVCVHLARQATGTAAKKSLLFELSQESFRNWTKIVPEFFEAYQHELDVYPGLNLKTLIWNPIMQTKFLSHQEAEMSAENMKFWLVAKNFRFNLDNNAQQAVRQEAKDIVDEYVKAGAEKQVNIPGKMSEAIVKALKGAEPITRDLLLPAEEEVMKVMGRDTWPRFKAGYKFREALKTMMTCDNYKAQQQSNF